jgi:hypothetical protein
MQLFILTAFILAAAALAQLPIHLLSADQLRERMISGIIYFLMPVQMRGVRANIMQLV